MRQALSRGLLVIATLFVIAVYYSPIGHVDFAENWGEGTFGIAIPARTAFVVGVDRGSPADRAGVRAGDHLLDEGNYAISSRVRAPYPGEREKLTFERSHAAYSVVLTAVPNPGFRNWQRIGGVLAYLPPTVFLVVAFLLVLAAVSDVVVVLCFCRGVFRDGPRLHVLVARALSAGIRRTHVRA